MGGRTVSEVEREESWEWTEKPAIVYVIQERDIHPGTRLLGPKKCQQGNRAEGLFAEGLSTWQKDTGHGETPVG